jgi:gliding motility-associated-like protein
MNYIRTMRVLLVLLLFISPIVALAQQALLLIENKGQWPAHVIGASSIGNHQVFLEQDGLTFHLRDMHAVQEAHDKGQAMDTSVPRTRGHVYQVKFAGSQSPSQITKSFPSESVYNYFLSPDPNQWASQCKAYGALYLREIYPHIDFKLYSQDGLLKYDFIVHPTGNTHDISLAYSGMDDIAHRFGRIEISLSTGQSYEQAPIVWQIIDGKKKYVPCEYALDGAAVHFQFPKGYDHQYDLIIDPQIIFSSYSGSGNDNFGYSATYDEDGNLYSGSSAFGQDYPTTLGAYQTVHAGGDSPIQDGIDMALSKYSADGTTMLWSTFIGGSGDDLPHSLIVNANQELYVYGCTGSPDFPIASGAFQNQFLGGSAISPVGTGATFPNGTDIAVVHLNSTGSALLGSTYLGGSGNDGINSAPLLKRNYADEFRGEISLDANDQPLIVSSTFSTDFPIANAFQNASNGGQEAVFCKLNPSLSSLIWASYLGGSSDDSGFSLTAGTDGSIYIAGGTASSDFPVANNALQSDFNGVVDGYIVRISEDGLNLLNGTYYGASNFDQIYFVETDDQGQLYGYGQSISPGNNLIANVGYSQSNSGILLVKIDPTLSTLVWSTVIGTGDANPNLSPSAFLVDYCNRIYISGWGVSALASPLNPGTHLFPMGGMEVTSDAEFPTSTTGDFYMAVFDENMTTLEYATFYGGNLSSEHVDGGTSRFDRKGVIYQSVCAGCGSNDDFPIVPANAWSATNNSSNCNNGVFKFDFQLPLTVADFEFEPSCVNTPVQFTSTSTYAQNYFWTFGEAGTSNQINPIFVFTEAGLFEVTLIVTHPMTCNLADTLTRWIEVIAPSNTPLPEVVVCEGQSATVGPQNPITGASYQWFPTNYLSETQIAQPTFSAGQSELYTVLVQSGACFDTLQQQVLVPVLALQLPEDTLLCEEGVLALDAIYSPIDASILWSESIDFSPILNDGPSDSDILPFIEIPTTFYAQVDVSGCQLVDSVQVQMVSFQTTIEGDFAVCEGDATSLQVLNPNDDFIYTWAPDALVLSGQNTPTANVVVPTSMYFSVQANYGNCTAIDSVFVQISALVDTDISATATPSIIVQGQSAQLNAQPNGYSYVWSPATFLDANNVDAPLATPSETITYYLIVTDGECSGMDSVTIRVVEFVCGPPSIYVPNAFTPNIDGVNEKLYVRANNIDRLYFVIYDRWGEKMFETQSLAQGWDGLYEGKILPPDVYTYYLEATCEGGSTYFDKGNITLIR